MPRFRLAGTPPPRPRAVHAPLEARTRELSTFRTSHERLMAAVGKVLAADDGDSSIVGVSSSGGSSSGGGESGGGRKAGVSSGTGCGGGERTAGGAGAAGSSGGQETRGSSEGGANGAEAGKSGGAL
eukprot:1532492-Prymnesium_polylepis.1